jgi:NAD(P)-dependent dehydrogenase (short-subunit alcohol dehydrogenase family)
MPLPRSNGEETMAKSVVVGASSGLGRCVGIGLAQRGDQVALLARRRDRIEAAATEAGPGAIGIECDVTDEKSCRAAIAEAADSLGGIDNLVYTPGIGPLRRMIDTDAATWRHVLDTNVTGAALVTAAAVPHLTSSNGKAVYFSSVGGNLTPPWPGLGAYAVSKAALERLVEAWRGEHPAIGFTCLVVGDCAGGEGDGRTGFNLDWDDRELAAEVHQIWATRGYLASRLLPVEDLVRVVHTILQTDSATSMPTVVATGAR